MSAYYNEIDGEKAEWIRELIKAGVVAPEVAKAFIEAYLAAESPEVSPK